MKRALGVLACFVVLSGSRAALAAPEGDYVGRYREGTFSLLSGAGHYVISGQGLSGLASGNGVTNGFVGLTVNGRGVIRGVVLDGRLDLLFYDGVIANTIVTPGVAVGYAIPVSREWAITPMARSNFLIPTGPGSSVTVQVTGEINAEYFLGKNAFLEPVLSVGALHNTGTSRGAFVLGVGYRLGVTF